MKTHMPTCPVTRRPDDPQAFCECGAGLANALTEMRERDARPEWRRLSDGSTEDAPGTLIMHTDHALGFTGQPAKVVVTRADRWILVNREFAVRLVDEGQMAATGQEFTAGRPDSVRYRFVRRFDDHTDLFERVDGDEAPARPLTVADYKRINPTCEHGLIKGMMTCPKCEPEQQAAAEAAAATGASARRADGRLPLHDIDALAEITQQAIRSAARVDELNEELSKADERNRQLRALLDEVLGSFTHQGYPGEPCLRTGWIGTRIVARWRRIAAGRLGYDELIEKVTGVELTDEQHAHLREAWEYREMHGRWPLLIHSGRQNGVTQEREALRQLIDLAQQAEKPSDKA